MKKMRVTPYERLVIIAYKASRTADFAMSKSITAAQFVGRITEFLQVKDACENTRHCETAAALYFGIHTISDMTVSQAARKTYLPESTLGRYRKYYAVLFSCFAKRYAVDVKTFKF